MWGSSTHLQRPPSVSPPILHLSLSAFLRLVHFGVCDSAYYSWDTPRACGLLCPRGTLAPTPRRVSDSILLELVDSAVATRLRTQPPFGTPRPSVSSHLKRSRDWEGGVHRSPSSGDRCPAKMLNGQILPVCKKFFTVSSRSRLDEKPHLFLKSPVCVLVIQSSFQISNATRVRPSRFAAYSAHSTRFSQTRRLNHKHRARAVPLRPPSPTQDTHVKFFQRFAKQEVTSSYRRS